MDLTDLGAWRQTLAEPLAGADFVRLMARVEEARAAATVYPPADRQFRAFALTPPEAVRVVILGQDPYHGPGQANGLAFSVSPGVTLPPSLRNIYRELESDLGCAPPPDGDLSGWAAQGVLLLNTVLTVEAGSPYPRLLHQSPHPSPLSAHRGFFGSRPFSAVNGFLTAHGQKPVDFSRGGI